MSPLDVGCYQGVGLGGDVPPLVQSAEALTDARFRLANLANLDLEPFVDTSPLGIKISHDRRLTMIVQD